MAVTVSHGFISGKFQVWGRNLPPLYCAPWLTEAHSDIIKIPRRGRYCPSNRGRPQASLTNQRLGHELRMHLSQPQLQSIRIFTANTLRSPGTGQQLPDSSLYNKGLLSSITLMSAIGFLCVWEEWTQFWDFYSNYSNQFLGIWNNVELLQVLGD